MPSMNLANKSWNRWQAACHYFCLIILANTAYQARISEITVFRTESFTPGGHLLLTDFTVNRLWIHFIAWGLSSSVDDESVGER